MKPCRIFLALSFSLSSMIATAAESSSLFISAQGEQFAKETSAAPRIDLQVSGQAGETLLDAPALRPLQADAALFYQSGPSGDYSADIDRAAGRIGMGEYAHLWLGRTHPIEEDGRSAPIQRTDAIGANWGQNQSDALNSRVSGWIGAGVHFREPTSGIALIAAFSPVFLPSFGPSLQLSETDAVRGSRFSRLPPQYAKVNGQVLPLRYRLETGAVRDIVLRNQGLVAAGYESDLLTLHAFTWSAPSPSPDVDADGILRIHTDDSLDVLATARPRFERRRYLGGRIVWRKGLGEPELALVHEPARRLTTVSASIAPFSFLRVGYLDTLGLEEKDPLAIDDNSTEVISPAYASKLVWLQSRVSFFRSRLTPSLRIEQNLSHYNLGRWVRPRVDYLIGGDFGVFAVANVLTGRARSYFGAWRSLDSVAMGADWRW